ncbi:MAG: hypothetical protein KME35_07915 [Aphanocapsa sp. GSE-SYN-MK-11-07L]|nr:hypothetical protein [Aphanocapsa sp. GSE-SYN-MK-11-07L]
MKNAPSLIETVGYLPLPDDAYRLAGIQFTRGKVGTAFQGIPEPDITVTELLRRQTTFQASKP